MKKPTPFGKYLLLDRINVGGMAEVFLAKSFGVEGFERVLAIKKILPTMVEDEEFITMFIDEARIAVQLNHANIVQIYELGKHDENYFIAMEYVAGRDLRTILDRYKKRGELMPQAQAVYVAQKMCEGLDYAHRKKDARGKELHIVHRDVSPQNILISFEGEVKLIDFGIAKAANRSQKTQAGILKGKFGYMSPEQVRGLPIDGRSDIFAVGVCLYEMLTGEKLFVGESDFSTLEKVRNAEVPPPREVNADVPEGLETVVMKALARDVEERYQHASDMQEDLMRFLLTDGTIFGAKHLSGFMHDSFAPEIAAEAERAEAYAQIEPPADMEIGAPTASKPAGPDPAEAFGPPPPEMLPAEGSERTVLFDATEQFEEGQAGAQAGGADGGGLASGVGVAALEDDTTGAGADAPTPVPAAISEEEDTDGAAAGPPPKNGVSQDGEPHGDAVARLADEIPSHPRGVTPDGGLLDQATRITTADDIQPIEIPPKKGGRPEIAARRPPAISPTKARSAVRTVGPPAASRNRNLLAIGIGSALAVVVAVTVVALVHHGPKPGSLAIITVPDHGVEIRVDDKLVDTTSPAFVKSLPAGKHMVTVRQKGTVAHASQQVDVVAGREARVRIRLEAPAAAPPKPAPTTPVAAGSPTAMGTPTATGTPGATGTPTATGTPAPGIRPAPGTPPKTVATTAPGTPAGTAPKTPANGGATKPPPVVPSTGTAILISDPTGATVTAHGKRLGRTPYTAKHLDLDGVHRFTFSKKGYTTKEVTIAFAGQPTQRAEVTLDRVPPRQHHRVTAVAHRTTPEHHRHVRRTHKAVAHGTGTLVAATMPVSKIIVDGHDTGRWTPVPPANPLKLSAGPHTVVFQLADGKSKTFKVTVQADKQRRLIYRFNGGG